MTGRKLNADPPSNSNLAAGEILAAVALTGNSEWALQTVTASGVPPAPAHTTPYCPGPGACLRSVFMRC